MECIKYNLPRLRKEKGFSQEALATAIGSKRGIIAKYETGAGGATKSTIAKLAKALKVEESDLVKPPQKYMPGKEVPNEFVEFIREAKKSQEFYREFIEDLAKKMKVQSDIIRKIWVKEGILKPEDLDLDQEVDSILAQIPEFTFPEHPSIPEEILEKLADDTILEIVSLVAALTESERILVLRYLQQDYDAPTPTKKNGTEK